jgi:hypothetical protein
MTSSPAKLAAFASRVLLKTVPPVDGDGEVAHADAAAVAVLLGVRSGGAAEVERAQALAIIWRCR